MFFSLIIPTLNEEQNVSNLLKRLQRTLQRLDMDSEVLIVDDDSKDSTREKALSVFEKWSGRTQGKVYWRRNKKKSLAESVVEGLEKTRGNIIGVMDADLSHPPELIAEMLNKLLNENLDVVIGSRYVEGGDIKHWPFKRRWLSILGCYFCRILTGIKDGTSGFFVLKREILDDAKINARGFKIGLEIFSKTRLAHVAEVPYVFENRKKGNSKLKLSILWAFALQVFRLLIVRIISKKYFWLWTILLWALGVGTLYFVIAISEIGR